MIWVLVANSASARIFCLASRTAHLEVAHQFKNEEAHRHPRDMVADRSGRVHDRKGAGRHAMEPVHSVKDNQAEKFARQLDEFLSRSLEEKKYEELVVIASPRFLGRMREHYRQWLPDAVLKLELAKDLTAAENEAIRSELDALTPPVTRKASNARKY